MSNSDEKTFAARLWSGSRPAQPEEKVLPLKAPTRPAPDDRAYVPFELRDHATRLHIKRATQPSRFPAYSYLLDISYDHAQQSAFTLNYTFMIVEVTGWNLEPVVHAISFGNCERLTEFHAKLHDRPASGEPLIESIRITSADEKLTK